MKYSRNRRYSFTPPALLTTAMIILAVQVMPVVAPTSVAENLVFLSTVVAAQDCDTATDTTCNDPEQPVKNTGTSDPITSDELPVEALSLVKELDVKLRYFKAIGFHDKSNAQRESIVAIYEKHGLSVPKKYQK